MPAYILVKHNEDFSRESKERFNAPSDYRAQEYVLGLLAFQKGLRAIDRWGRKSHSPSVLYVKEKGGTERQVSFYRAQSSPA